MRTIPAAVVLCLKKDEIILNIHIVPRRIACFSNREDSPVKSVISFLSILLLVISISACEDDVVEALPSRYVYYTDAGHELQRYDVTLKKIERPGLSDVHAITSVAQNGIVLFETNPTAEARLWGLCEDGSVIPVPMPVAESVAEEYVYGAAHASLSAEGHHAAWPVYRRPSGSSDSTAWVQVLCTFDCGAWEMVQVDVSTFLQSEFQNSGFSPDIVVLRDLRISGDGSRVVFSVAVSDLQEGGGRMMQHLLMVWENEEFRMLQGRQSAIEFLSFTPDYNTLYFVSAGTYFAIDFAAGIVSGFDLRTDRKDILTPHSFSRGTGEYISSVVDGEIIVLTRLSDGSRTVVLPNIRELTIAYPEINYGTLGDWASVSPDGQWVVFPWLADEESHLFIISRDGIDIRRIATGSFPVPAVVSSEIPL